jgi:uncharacterized membrane protein HdeD (DUF308 family)
MQQEPKDRRRRVFSRGVGILVTAIGAVAILGPEAAHTMVARTMGLVLIVTGLLGLIGLLFRRRGQPRRVVLIWSAVALASGAALMASPAHGLAAAGALVGLLLIGHGLAAAAVATGRHWSAPAARIVAGLTASLLALTGLALMFGKPPGDQADEILIGVDVVMFGAYLILGHELIEDDGSPSTSSR